MDNTIIVQLGVDLQRNEPEATKQLGTEEATKRVESKIANRVWGNAAKSVVHAKAYT